MLSPFRVRTIRATTKPSTGKCDLNTCTLFLLAESKYSGCTRLAEIMEDLSQEVCQEIFVAGTLRTVHIYLICMVQS